MTDRKICKRIVKAGSCFDFEDIYCNACPLNNQNCDCVKSFDRAKQWLKDNPKIRKDFSKITTEQLFEAIESYNSKEFGVGTHPCKGLDCIKCPYYDPSAIKCSLDYKKVHEAHVKEMNRRLAENEGKEDKEFLPKTLSVKEIVSKWWEIDENKYAKVSMVNTSDNNILNGDILFCFEGIADNVVKYVRDSKGNAIRSFVDRDWFEHHESYDFPPEN